MRTLSEFRNERLVRQEFDISCAAAALATILRYHHGDPVTERGVALGMINREEYLENPMLLRLRQGFSILDMKRYVERRGYAGIGYGNVDLDDLVTMAPVIVPIDKYGYDHFVVFRGMVGNRVLLGDPAFGNFTMLAGRFEDVWKEMPDIGRVAFVVERQDGRIAPATLVPTEQDFVFLR